MKRLYRSKKDSIIGGVCGGIGEYFNIDTVIVRILWLVFVFLAGAGVLAYIVAWIIIPSQDKVVKGESPGKIFDETEKGIFWGGIALVVVGLILILVTFRAFWIRVLPVILITIGMVLVLRYKR